MAGRLAGRVALVSGGGWNIGRAIAERFAREGAAVTICGRRPELLEHTAEAIRAAGGRVLAHAADATRRADMEELVARTLASFGRLDAVAAIAGGGGGHEPLDTIEPELWEHVVSINLFGTFHLFRAALPTLRAQRSGTLITCSGGGAWFPILGVHATAYAAAKAALCRLTDQLAVELLGSGVRVNCLQPGRVWSPHDLELVAAEERRTGQPHPERAHVHPPEDAAELALFLASEASAPLTGRIVSVDDEWWRDPDRVRAVSQSLHAYCLRRVEA